MKQGTPARLRVAFAACATAWLSLAGGMQSTNAGQACSEIEFEGNGYAVCSFDPGETELRLFWRDRTGSPHKAFASVAAELAESGRKLEFAINGGMFQADFTPVGLHVENGEVLRKANVAGAPANQRPIPNFYKKPNGVFAVSGGTARVMTTDEFVEQAPAAEHATQSGPMLVIEGRLHPALIEGSHDRTWRTGVGVTRDGIVHFAISLGHVNFHDFARLFRDRLESDNALFLDGGRGTGIYAPELGRNDRSWHGGFGPIIGAVSPGRM